MKALAASAVKLCTRESTTNITNWVRNIMRKTWRRPMKSETHAHRNRPAALAIEMSPTKPAAVAALVLAISCAIGAA